MTVCKTPCSECVFRRDSKPGSLGGSPPEVYVGQIHGSFAIPCHSHYGTGGTLTPEVRARAFDIPQCAGAAIFRANLKRAHLMPVGIEPLAANTDTVFSSYAEFYAHHKRISLFEAEKQLQVLSPAQLLRNQMGKKDNMFKTFS